MVGLLDYYRVLAGTYLHCTTLFTLRCPSLRNWMLLALLLGIRDVLFLFLFYYYFF